MNGVSDGAIIALTMRTALLSTAIVIPIGLLLAWLLARKEWPGKSIVDTLIALPLVMPPVATGLILLELFGRRGPLGSLLHRTGIDVVFTWRAVVIAMVVMSLPLFVRSARVAIRDVNPRFEHVARTLGSSEREVFFRVTLPLAARGVIAGAVLAFARAIGEFGATIVIAGNIPGRTTTLSLAIFDRVQLGRDSDAFRLLAVSAVIAFAAIWTSELVTRKRDARI
jgi:molybdate transport system permease protein